MFIVIFLWVELFAGDEGGRCPLIGIGSIRYCVRHSTLQTDHHYRRHFNHRHQIKLVSIKREIFLAQPKSNQSLRLTTVHSIMCSWGPSLTYKANLLDAYHHSNLHFHHRDQFGTLTIRYCARNSTLQTRHHNNSIPKSSSLSFSII